ncbi:MAG: PadR family transcriptional regulator [Anaerolineae bacterium]|nr:PadR family transcriptional regulator [Anaerolineae bacterium]
MSKRRRRGPHGPRGPRGPRGPHRWGPPGRDFWQHGPPGRSPHDWRAAFEQFLGQPPEDHWMFGGRRFRPWQMGEAIFNPFVAMVLSKGGGLLPLYVLHLVAEEPRYGNELMTVIEERTDGAWGTNPGAIYPLLNDLEAQGLIQGEWEDPDRRTVRRYTITDAGREELDRLKAVMRPKLKEALDVLRNMLDDLDDDEFDQDIPNAEGASAAETQETPTDDG